MRHHPVVDLVHRAVQADEQLGRRIVWERREPELTRLPVEPPEGAPEGPQRPVPLPDGEIERYSDRTWFSSLAGLASSLAATNDLKRAVVPVLDLIPKPARFGRDAFAARLDRVLAARGVVTMDPGALRRLDRLDVLVVAPGVLSEDGVAAAGADVVVAGSDHHGLRLVSLGPSPLDVHESSEDPVALVRRLQRESHVVGLVAAGPIAALAHADVAIGQVREGRPVPWEADVLVGPDLADLLLLVEATGAAREVSHQSVPPGAARRQHRGRRGLRRAAPHGP
ncbi:MAG: hypothetical protein KY462_14920 [Actinobacteria bacterium]|nr:hypothetical protein [Actinomycetota bacterium]